MESKVLLIIIASVALFIGMYFLGKVFDRKDDDKSGKKDA